MTPISRAAVLPGRQRGQATLGLLLLGAALAVGLVLAAFIVASSLERIKLAGDKITVKGYAEEKVVSDAGAWRASVSTRGDDLESTYRSLETNSGRVVKLVEALAGKEATLLAGPVNTQTLFEYGPNGAQTGRVLGLS